MKHALLIHLDPDDAGAWWLATDHLGNGIGAPQHGALAAVGAAAPGRPATVLLPTERCLVLEVKAPTRDRAQLARALPALIEDRVTTDVESLHLTAGPVGDDGTLRVVAIDDAALGATLAKLAAAGIAVAAVVPDALCLPRGASLAFAGGRALLGTPRRAAAAPIEFAGLLLDQEPFPDGVAVSVVQEDAERALPLLQALDARGVAQDSRPLARHELERILLRGAAQAAAFDLLHGRHRRHDDGARWRRWRLPLALAAAWLVLVVAVVALDLFRLVDERRQLEAELAALLPQVAPEAVGQPDPRFYLEQRLARRAGGGVGGVALDDVVRATEALAQVAGAELMLIDAKSGSVELALRAPDLAALERARDAVERALGRAVELRGATANGGRAEGRLVATGGAS